VPAVSWASRIRANARWPSISCTPETQSRMRCCLVRKEKDDRAHNLHVFSVRLRHLSTFKHEAITARPEISSEWSKGADEQRRRCTRTTRLTGPPSGCLNVKWNSSVSVAVRLQDGAHTAQAARDPVKAATTQSMGALRIHLPRLSTLARDLTCTEAPSVYTTWLTRAHTSRHTC
jgi:hypothetical protein